MTQAIGVIVEGLLSELREARSAGRSEPELFEAARTALIVRLDSAKLSPGQSVMILEHIFEELLRRLGGIDKSNDPAFEIWLIRTLAAAIDLALARPPEFPLGPAASGAA